MRYSRRGRKMNPENASELLDMVDVPVSGLGAGTGTVEVEDARTGRALRLAGLATHLVGVTVCVRLPSWGCEDGLHRVLLPGGGSCWVRPLRRPGAAA